MARVTHAAQIDLRFGDSACELLDFHAGICAGNFPRKCFDLFGQGFIRVNRQAESMPKGVSGRAGAALRGLRAGAGPRILAVSC